MTRSITDLTIKSIAILRALKLGDFLLFIPAARALRQAFPSARIDYVGLPWSKELVTRFDRYFDSFIEFPGFPAFPEKDFQPEAVAEFLLLMQKQNFDLVLQAHGNGRHINPFIPLLGGRYMAGYSCPGAYRPQGWFMDYPENVHEVLKHLQLMNFLRVPLQGRELEFPITEKDKRDLARLPELTKVKKKTYICIHPGSTSSSRWPVERFAAVADAHASLGLKVVITGTETERALGTAVQRAMKAESVNLIGKTSVGVLAALLADARLLIANDTGVSHLATAVGVPSVTIFNSTDPNIWAALDSKRHPYVNGEKAEKPDTVIEIARKLLQTEGRHK